MTLNDQNKLLKWESNGEDEKGYYFLLTDTFHHQDYSVVLFKDDGKITVNGDYLRTVPDYIAAAIRPRIDYFMAKKRISNGKKYHHNHNNKKNDKKGK